MYTHRRLAILFALAFAASSVAVAQTPVSLKSPDGALELSIAAVREQSVQESGGQLAYRVAFRGKPVLDWSNFGLAIQGAPVLGSAVRIESTKTSASDDTWNSIAGKANPIRDHYNAVTVQTIETAPPGRRLDIEARAYDDGVAFRYSIPEQPALKELRIADEATQFRFHKDATTWSLILRDFQTSNEDDYHELTISGLHPEYLIGLPMLLEVPGTAWVGLTEASIDDWAGLFVHTAGNPNVLTARLAPRVEDRNAPHLPWPIDAKLEPSMISVVREAPARSPWRVLMIADDPGRLVESNMVVNLNPPCAISDTSWIKPGKTAWDWWSGEIVKNVPFVGGMNTATMKYYVDFSARNGFPYMLVDAGWASSAGGPAYGAHRSPADLTRNQPDVNIPELVEYAKSKNVRIWLWAYWTDVDAQMADAFAQFEKWGIAGVKIDFMDRADQWMVDWYRSVAQKAAEHHLLLDYHGAFKPDGLRRTYPNVLTREGVMGAEYNKWSARETPTHNVTLPFTRMLAGPMDYTPGGFDNVTKENFEARNVGPSVMGTRVHQIALFVVFESPFQMVADHPAAYEGQKELAFLKVVPTTWDETHVLNGRPSKYITIARRKAREWYVGSLTNWDPRELEIPLRFLGTGRYKADIYSDGPDAERQPKESVLETRTVDASTTLKLKLAPGGGAAIRIVPAD
jgi:alpha-glucosidase